MFIEIKGQSILPLTDDKTALRGLYLNPGMIIAGSIAILIGIVIGAGEVWLGLWSSIGPQAVSSLILTIMIPIGIGCVAILLELERRGTELCRLHRGGYRDVCVTVTDWSYGAVLTTPVEENMRFYADYKAKVLQLLRSEELQRADLATHLAESDPSNEMQDWYLGEQHRALQLIKAVAHDRFMVDPQFLAVKAAHAALNTK